LINTGWSAFIPAGFSRASGLPIYRSSRPAKIELTINLKIAKALGINMPITLLGRADEVIE
jgi:putative ABC transport system substrate-binding protein